MSIVVWRSERAIPQAGPLNLQSHPINNLGRMTAKTENWEQGTDPRQTERLSPLENEQALFQVLSVES